MADFRAIPATDDRFVWPAESGTCGRPTGSSRRCRARRGGVLRWARRVEPVGRLHHLRCEVDRRLADVASTARRTPVLRSRAGALVSQLTAYRSRRVTAMVP
jgi:hypothetical protein